MEYTLKVSAEPKDEYRDGPGFAPDSAIVVASALADHAIDLTKQDTELPWRVTRVTGTGRPPVAGFTGDHAFLSNFWSCPVPFAGRDYPSAEHAYQAAKTNLPRERQQVAACKTPADAKRAGRALDLRPDWEAVRKRMMFTVVFAKFSTSPGLARALAATGDAPLVEANHWHDNFWGDCTCGRDACAEPGLNALGTLLEAVRFAVS